MDSQESLCPWVYLHLSFEKLFAQVNIQGTLRDIALAMFRVMW